MRIIKKDERERKTKCSCCNTEIAYKMEDVHLGLWEQKYIKCPVCNELSKISMFDKKV